MGRPLITETSMKRNDKAVIKFNGGNDDYSFGYSHDMDSDNNLVVENIDYDVFGEEAADDDINGRHVTTPQPVEYDDDDDEQNKDTSSYFEGHFCFQGRPRYKSQRYEAFQDQYLYEEPYGEQPDYQEDTMTVSHSKVSQ
ncbi:hypothetical protein NDU88_003520 [Pleurodeles waltl]|uniref:Uncharacterized protein n=1 Tax=Pleurodeles waltl TaxID=8319 RepID=A0AAV7M5J9_PLEWA|nr:hypothetical protein NDU88_003520 [Pleurodeles waltl]